LPRVSCLPASAFTGQAFHRLAAQVTDERLEKAQIEIARAAAETVRVIDRCAGIRYDQL